MNSSGIIYRGVLIMAEKLSYEYVCDYFSYQGCVLQKRIQKLILYLDTTI